MVLDKSSALGSYFHETTLKSLLDGEDKEAIIIAGPEGLIWLNRMLSIRTILNPIPRGL